MDETWYQPVLNMMYEAEAAQTERDLVNAVRLHAPDVVPSQGIVLKFVLMHFPHRADALSAIQCAEGEDADEAFFLAVARALWEPEEMADDDHKRPRSPDLLDQLLELEPHEIEAFVLANNIDKEFVAELLTTHASDDCVAPVLRLILQLLTKKHKPEEEPPQEEPLPEEPQKREEPQDMGAFLDELRANCELPAAPPHDANPLVDAALLRHSLLRNAPFHTALAAGFIVDALSDSRKWGYLATLLGATPAALKKARALFRLVRDHLPALRRLRPTRALLAALLKHVHALAVYVADNASPEQLAWWQQADLVAPAVMDIEWLLN